VFEVKLITRICIDAIFKFRLDYYYLKSRSVSNGCQFLDVLIKTKPGMDATSFFHSLGEPEFPDSDKAPTHRFAAVHHWCDFSLSAYERDFFTNEKA